MNYTEILSKIKTIAAEHLGHDANKITEDQSFVDDLGADSLDTVEMVMALEVEFDIEVADDAAENINTVADAAKLVESLI
jgi:acyl carrier protein